MRPVLSAPSTSLPAFHFQTPLEIRSYHPSFFVIGDLRSNRSIPSAQRSEALIFIIHRFLEEPAVADDFNSPNRIGTFTLAPSDTSQENIDTEEEKQLAEQLKAQRLKFVAELRASQATTEATQGEKVF